MKCHHPKQWEGETISDETIENGTPTADARQPNKRKPGKKGKAATKPGAAKKSKPKAERARKKAEVISLMKRTRAQLSSRS